MVENAELFVADAAEEAPVYDTSIWSADVWADFEQKKRIVDFITEKLGPTFVRLKSPEGALYRQEIMETEGISKSTFWRYMARYFQSGMDIYSLMDQRYFSCPRGYGTYEFIDRPGRTSEYGYASIVKINAELEEQFAYGLKFLKSKRAISISEAYNEILRKFYRVKLKTEDSVTMMEKPESEMPTYRQFYYYLTKHMTKKEKYIKENSANEYWNNRRLLFGDSLVGVAGPLFRCEMDEVEVNISLVSSINPNQTVGRAIVYIITDVYTRMILAVSASFENNSVLGMTNCLQNLIEDKVEFCARYGVTITEDEWPTTGFMPNTICTDRGAEYTSHEMKRLCNQLGITHMLLPAAMGSFKGTVEQWFHRFGTSNNAAVEDAGGITTRHDSTHHEDACMTMNQFMQMLLEYVRYHNTHYIDGYGQNAEHLMSDVKPIPVELWEHGCKEYGYPRRITNDNQFKFSLLHPIKKVSIGRDGVKWNGLYYMNFGDQNLYKLAVAADGKRLKMDCRIDARDVGCLYYLHEGELRAIPLNDRKNRTVGFAGISMAEWDAIRKMIRSNDKAGEWDNRIMQMRLADVNDMLVRNARKTWKSDTSEFRIARTMEQAIANTRFLLFKDLAHVYGNNTGIEVAGLLGITEKERLPGGAYYDLEQDYVFGEIAETITVDAIDATEAVEDDVPAIAEKTYMGTEITPEEDEEYLEMLLSLA